MRLALVLLLSWVACVASTEDDSTQVQLTKGPIKGEKFTSSLTGKTLYAFRGIPFAQPPVNELRFKPPLEPEAWTEVKDCTQDWSVCPQTPFLFPYNITDQSEDCLFINVYTPETNTNKKLPVFVWIFGGAFVGGSSRYTLFGPDMLVGEDLVVVTFNYRLGALGFLSLGTEEAPGNAGFKDQILALKWVQEEISKFGGDPNQVTIGGWSAGSFSATLHTVSPLSKGLFHRVIGQSGNFLQNSAWDNDGSQYGNKLAEFVSCSNSDPNKVISCLRNTDVSVLLTNQVQVSVSYDNFIEGEVCVWRGVIDKGSSSEPFLPDTPTNLFNQDMGPRVPHILGNCRDEGVAYLGFISPSEAVVKNITESLEYFIPASRRGSLSANEKTTLTSRLADRYFGDVVPSFANISGYMNFYTEAMFSYGTTRIARMLAETTDVYLYNFNFDGNFKYAFVNQLNAAYNISIIAHGDELLYLFLAPEVTNQTTTAESTESRNTRRMVRMWANFIKYGNPTPIHDATLGGVSWLPATEKKTKHLIINDELSFIEENLIGSNQGVWDDIYDFKTKSTHLGFSATMKNVFNRVQSVVKGWF